MNGLLAHQFVSGLWNLYGGPEIARPIASDSVRVSLYKACLILHRRLNPTT